MVVNRQESVDLPWSVPVDVRWPTLKPHGIVLAYDEAPRDTLYVQLGDDPRPGYFVPIEPDEPATPGLSVKISLDGATILGLMVEGYVTWADRRSPAWLEVAPFAGVPPSALPGRDLATADLTRRDGALVDLLDEARTAWETFTRMRGGR